MTMSEAVKEAVKRERDVGDYVVERYATKLSDFEEEYDMTTEEFVEKFEDGDLGDEEDFFEWFALAKAREHWREKLEQLKSAV